ncbi:zinc finger MYM-type protein 1-like [Helianthus annuus]|uniref:zinc finger MYM-type protein 1-like n=1 Tax=Helianthus annuus TaxID=4232 RepID=UPI001652C44B|nr:zinc finger MYM-type protein 1-like [Helianthus annuus]
MIDNVSIIGTLAAQSHSSESKSKFEQQRQKHNSVMMKPKSKKQALIGNFFKRKYEEINDNDSSPNVGNDIQANDDVDASPNVDNENIQANDDVDASPNVDNDNPTTSISNNTSWLEYSIKEDKVYCLYCYLFKEDVGNQGGRDTWSSSSKGFCDWSKKGSLKEHVGNVDSHHLKAAQKCHNLMNQKKHMDENMKKLTKEEMIANYYRLLGSVMSARFCLENSLPFRGHDESEESNSQEIKDDVFGLLVDDSSDVSLKEQMAVVVRFVYKLGAVRESLIGIVHVKDTASITLKEAIDDLLASNQLSIKQVRGQGYDGASNMRGEFNGLKALILKDNPSAHYIHCFAHQLHFLQMKSYVKGGKKARVEKELLEGEIKTGKGLNQEVSLARADDTRWGSHHRTIISLLRLFPEVVTVLQYVKEDGDCSQQRTNAKGILSYFKKLEFVFYMHLMGDILSYTNALSKHLQQKGKDLLEATNLINGTKRALNALRQNGFEPMLEKVTSFCKKYNITMLDMTESYGNPRNRKNVITNRHHFEVDIFNEVLDMQIQELGNRFSEVTTTLIKNMSGLNPSNGFSKFDPSKILAFAKMYPDDFTTQEIGTLLGDIESFRHTISDDDNFDNLNGISDLARLMVETGTHISCPIVYRVIRSDLSSPDFHQSDIHQIFICIDGESIEELIKRYIELYWEMVRLKIIKTNEELVNKLANALPDDRWSTYMLDLRKIYLDVNLSLFIEKIKEREREFQKIRNEATDEAKLKSEAIVQEVEEQVKEISAIKVEKKAETFRLVVLFVIMAEDGNVQIEKFDGKKFGWWKMQIEALLCQKDLDVLLEDERPEKCHKQIGIGWIRKPKQ